MFKLALTFCALMVSSMLSLGAHEKVSVHGGGTYQSLNDINNSFNLTVNEFNIVAKRNYIEKGKITVSSLAAAPIDAIAGIDFEANARVDAIRVFETYPDIVWVHGFATGFISFGVSPAYGPLAGTTHFFTPTDGEFIGAISPFGRTNFLSVFENGGALPNFFTATESDLITLVGGFSRLLLTNGAEPGKVCIETHGGNITIP